MLHALASYLSSSTAADPADANASDALVDDGLRDATSADGRPMRLPGEELHQRLRSWIDADNIIFADGFDDDALGPLGNLVTTEFEIDETSRSDWLEHNRKAMDLAMQVAQEKSYPWPKASNVIYPLITVASIQFAARAYPAIVAGRNVVKGVVVGKDDGTPMPQPAQGPMPSLMGSTALTPPGGPMPAAPSGGPQQQPFLSPPGAKQTLASLIGDHMSWQLLDEQEEWEPEMDMLLHVLPIVGCEFKKTYFDPDKGRNASVRVAAQHVVVNYRAKSLERAPRITEEVEFYPLEIEEFVSSGLWADFEGLTQADEDGANDRDAPIKFLEQHRWYDLDGDGMREPYIVTVHKQTSKVVRIVARYDEEGIHWNATKGRIQKFVAVQYYTKFDFLPNPDGGIYGVGFGQLLRPLNESINSTLNMLLDAGHLANTQGGFIGKGLNMNSGSLRFQPGEWKPLNVPGAAIKDAIVPLSVPGPSAVLFQLLGMLVEAGKEIAAVKDVLTGEQQQGNVPATTTLALIEQGLKVFSAIYKRVHRALKAEYTKLYRLNRLYLDKDAHFKSGDEWKSITQDDYKNGGGVEPYSDPTMVSDMQKLGRAQFLMGLLADKGIGPLLSPKAIADRVFDAASIDQPDKLYAPAPPPNPAIMAKAMELHTKQAEMESGALLRRAQALQAISAAIANLATAEKTGGDANLAWLKHQLDVYQAQMDATADPNGSQQPGDGPAGAGAAPLGAPGGPAPPIAGAMPPAAMPPNQDQPVQGVQSDRDGHAYLPQLKGHHP